MTADELLSRISSRELTAWLALFAVQADEADRRQLEADAPDGEIIISGHDPARDDRDEDEDDPSETPDDEEGDR